MIAGDLSVKNYAGTIETAGDFNGDGLNDIVFSETALLTSPPNMRTSGVGVLYGKAGPWPALFWPNTIDGTNGFRVAGDPAEAYAYQGRNPFPGSGPGAYRAPEVAGGADLNNDGFDDIAPPSPTSPLGCTSKARPPSSATSSTWMATSTVTVRAIC